MQKPSKSPDADSNTARWYQGVTRYQWLVLVIASLGWVFDVFEGQVFVTSMNATMRDLLQTSDKREIDLHSNYTFGAFLIGGALGGVAFGMLSDRIGRKRTMTYTIVMYSAFTCLSSLSQSWQHLAILRFLVAMGVGGEWAVASTLVAEVFPRRARAWSLGIFHASSVLGTFLAIAAGYYVVSSPDWGWRWAYALGALPALLIIWVRVSLQEPESWRHARDRALETTERSLGRIGELFSTDMRRQTLVGVSLATVGLATFWGTHIYGKDLYRIAALPELESKPADQRSSLEKATLQKADMIGMFLVTTGGGLGLISFGPLCERLGRRGTFALFHLGGLAIALGLFQGLAGMPLIYIAAALPVFGFLTLGMHAGYAIYFPELFPTRLRGTGSSFCFNVGRVLAAPSLFLGIAMQSSGGYSRENAASILSILFLLGLVVLLFAPETRGRELPE